jgi:hypothetical protein
MVHSNIFTFCFCFNRRVRARIVAVVVTQDDRAGAGQEVGVRAAVVPGQGGEERAAANNDVVANLQHLFEEVEQPEQRMQPAPVREFENGRRTLFFASEQVKASPRARHAQEIREFMQPQNLPRKHAPAVASLITEVEVQVPLQGLVDDGCAGSSPRFG